MKTKDFYNSVVDKYVEAFFSDFSDKDELDRFLSMLPLGSCILDVGCGPGQFTKYFIDKGYFSEGIDFAREMIMAARKLVPEGKFRIMDMRRLAYSNNSFNGILIAYSFLHILEKEALSTLLGINRILKPGGVLSLMLKEGDGEVYLPSTWLIGEFYFTKLWRLDEILGVLEQTGFALIAYRKDTPKNPEETQYSKLHIMARKPIK